MASLEHGKVDELLQHYDSPKVSEELYDMGKMLVDECSKRSEYLDAKSTTIAGYSGAIIGLMVSTFPIWTTGVDKWAVLLVACGTVIGLLGAAVAFISTWPGSFLLPSDTDWLEKDGLRDADRLKRYYISSLHLSIVSYEKLNAKKVSKVKISQVCVAVMVLCLLIGLGDGTYKIMTTSSSGPSSVHAASTATALYDHGTHGHE